MPPRPCSNYLWRVCVCGRRPWQPKRPSTIAAEMPHPAPTQTDHNSRCAKQRLLAIIGAGHTATPRPPLQRVRRRSFPPSLHRVLETDCTQCHPRRGIPAKYQAAADGLLLMLLLLLRRPPELRVGGHRVGEAAFRRSKPGRAPCRLAVKNARPVVKTAEGRWWDADVRHRGVARGAASAADGAKAANEQVRQQQQQQQHRQRHQLMLLRRSMI